METIFSTATIHPRDRFEYWHRTAEKQFAAHDCIPESRSTFEAELLAARFGPLELVQFRVSPMQVMYTLDHIERTRPASLFLCYQLAGKTFISQNGRDVDLEPGTLALVDPLLPYEARFWGQTDVLVIKVQRRDLRARLGRNHGVAARRVSSERLDDAVALSTAARLPSLAGSLTSTTEEMLGIHALDLLALAIGRTLESGAARISPSKATTLGRLRSVIEANLSDPELDAQRVADAVGISVRYANDLLASQDTSLNRFILSRRLARCRNSLEDPNQRHRTITDIAQCWGFSDMTHFGRRFREAYGVLPSEYQRLAARSGMAGRF